MTELLGDGTDLTIDPGRTRSCLDPWTYVEFRVDGSVAPCCVRPSVGSLQESTLSEILNGPSIRALRASLLTGRLDAFCTRCSAKAPTTPEQLQARVRAEISAATVPVDFDPSSYRLANPDAGQTNEDSRRHFRHVGRYEGRDLRPRVGSVMIEVEFDPDSYLEANPDVAAAGVDPVRHYLQFGRKEGRRLRPRTLIKDHRPRS